MQRVSFSAGRNSRLARSASFYLAMQQTHHQHQLFVHSGEKNPAHSTLGGGCGAARKIHPLACPLLRTLTRLLTRLSSRRSAAKVRVVYQWLGKWLVCARNGQHACSPRNRSSTRANVATRTPLATTPTTGVHTHAIRGKLGPRQSEQDATPLFRFSPADRLLTKQKTPKLWQTDISSMAPFGIPSATLD